MVSLQSNNLHFITHSTSGGYVEKIWNGPEDSSTDSPSYWESRTQYSWDPIPGMTNVTSEPVVCKYGAGIFVFGLDLEGRLKYNYYDGKKWESEDERFLGNDSDRFIAKPGTVNAYPKYLELIILSEDRLLHQIWYTGGKWIVSPSTKFKNDIVFKEPPVLTTWPGDPSRMDIFCVAANGRLYHNWWTVGGWYPGEGKFEDLSDDGKLLVTNQVQAISRKKESVILLVVGLDNKLHWRAYDNGTWGAWDVVAEAGFCRGIPELVSFDENRVDVFVIGVNGWARHLKYTEENKAWSLVADDVLGPTNFDRPTAVSRAPGKIDLAVVSSYGGIRYRLYSATDGWDVSEPERIAGSTLSRVGTAS